MTDADNLDVAADLAEAERAFSVALHAQRAITPIPVCDECCERPVHVTEKNVRWRLCKPCGDELIGSKAP